MGPLAGVKVVEMAGIGPGPLAAMLLADLGATVIRVDRKEPYERGVKRPIEFDLALRNRKSIRVDLKQPGGVALVLDLVEKADALIEGFRPGVMERLGLDPERCLERNPRLVYGRITGWGQDGPLAQAAGHDINYIAITGLLHAIGRAGQPPTLPLNVMGDYAGGSLYTVFGLMAALFETQRSGKGQVVDVAMVDGVASLLTVLLGLVHAGKLDGPRGTNFIDSGAPFYEVYECADGAYLAVGPIESRFYEQLLERLGLDAAERARLGAQWNADDWPRAKAVLAARFRARPRHEWERRFEGADVCVSPVLNWQQAWSHPQLRSRGTFIEVGGLTQPAPGPRFSRTVADHPRPPAALTTENAAAALGDWLTEEQIAAHRGAHHFI